MNEKKRPQILLTNDDGIDSPGIWAAAEALSKLGFVWLAAPRDQASSTGRSLPPYSDGKIEVKNLPIGQQNWEAYAVGGTPAQVVLHTILEIMPVCPDLVVSGINYGENLGSSITISGTVGAAMEGAAMGIPSLAVSLQLPPEINFLEHNKSVDFSIAAHFTAFFAKMLMDKKLPDDVDLLKIDVPLDATPQTAWRITRLSRSRYYVPVIERKGKLSERGFIGGRMDVSPEQLERDSDVYTLIYDRLVSVTPLSLDMTSRIALADLENQLRA